MNKTKIPKLLWAIIIFAVLVNLATIVIALRSPNGNSYPREVKTTSAPVDYNRIDDIIAKRIANLNLQNGTDGKNGANGRNGVGINGSNGQNATPEQIAAAVTAYLQANPPPSGAQGDPGAPAPLLELRYNASKSQIEYRYSGQSNWIALVSACTLTNTCP